METVTMNNRLVFSAVGEKVTKTRPRPSFLE